MQHIAGPQTTSLCSKSFRYNVARMPQELISSVYQLAYGKTGFVKCISLKVTEFINDIKWGLTTVY